jgi:hypothetical protein
MLELLAQKSLGAAVSLNLARMYLDNHEWGRARLLLHSSFGRCDAEQLAQAGELLDEVHCRLGMCEDRRLSDVGSQAEKEKLER